MNGKIQNNIKNKKLKFGMENNLLTLTGFILYVLFCYIVWYIEENVLLLLFINNNNGD
jgi:hypothetical protein